MLNAPKSLGSSSAAALLAATLLLPSTAAHAQTPAPPATGSPTATAETPRLHWGRCPAAPQGAPSLDGYQCATMKAPLDYANPTGRTIELGLVKHPATGSAAPLGTLFYNPGGPGGLGSVFLPGGINGFGTDVLAKFDIVSWDPRGMGGLSSPTVQCFDTEDQEGSLLAPVSFPPLTGAQQQQWTSAYGQLFRACAGRDDALLAHVSTADNARDLDLMRRAVGEDKLFYYGTSYGTFLGATYANMFPSNVRRMILDGAIDPTAWTDSTSPPSTFVRAGSDLATAAVVKDFLRLCGNSTTQQCAFSAGTPDATSAKFQTLLARAGQQPLVVDPSQPGVTAGDLVALMANSLYVVQPVPGFSAFPGWSGLATQLQALWQAGTASPAPSSTPPGPQATAGAGTSATASPAPQPYHGVEQQLAVICGESPNPATARAAIDQAQTSLQRAGTAGQNWPWTAYCVNWPAKAASSYLGPWNRTDTPIVVVGTTGDPATPYSDAQAVAKLFPGAHLVTVNGYGHTELFNPSSCTQALLTAYLDNGTTPPDGATCPQNTQPFH
ncbi:alpha/beta hydrolase [Kitasatospora sp. NPDC096128]|uniref:alpha/beta hydrolase n=1 Tax=Kitasatospora sp. NPDC096128 TaxID=3155547 RepID=UPI00331E765C